MKRQVRALSKTQTLGSVCDRLSSGKSIRASEVKPVGAFPVIGGNGVRGYTDTYNFDGECAVIGRQGAACGNVRFHSGKAYMTEHAVVAVANESNNSQYLSYLLKTMRLGNLSGQSAQPGLSVKVLSQQAVSLPSLDGQRQAVAILGTLDRKIELNNRLNGYLAALGETMANRCSNETDGTLDDICSQSKETVSLEAAQLETYVSTENLLPNKAGLQLSAGLPTSGKVTRYRKGDTLVANIRPYFKKIWYATDEGTCSGDVIVFRANDARYAPYVFFSLCRDEFFEYVMLGAKGTKMPRGDKKQMMTFPICTNCNSTDLQLLQELASTIGTNHAENRQLARLRDTLLPKLMSGEIDVSKVDLTQLNSHLTDC